jgi:hypothetical protein
MDGADHINRHCDDKDISYQYGVALGSFTGGNLKVSGVRSVRLFLKKSLTLRRFLEVRGLELSSRSGVVEVE